jgi:hypothetical protein
MLNNHGGSDMHAAKPERWHCQKGGGIEYTVKKYTATVSIPGHAACHHNNVHDRIEYIEPTSKTSTTLSVKVGFIPQHSGAYTWMWGWELNCWQFTSGYVGKVYDHQGPPTRGSPFITKAFTFTPQKPENKDHWLRCGIIDLWYRKQGFKNGKFCAARDAGHSTWKDHHYDNADMPFTMGGGGSGCKCDCDESLDCKLTHHHTSGYKRSFTHCVVTKAPTAYPTPSPTAYPTSQPTQHCVVGAWGPWSTCNGMIGNVKVWSGGCRHSAYGGGWHFYCLNGVDQNNMSGYGYTHGDSNFRTQRAGWFRINYFGDHHGYNGHWQHHHCRIQVNGRDIFYNHDFKWHDGGWQQLKGDVTWRANANWRFQISIYGSHGYQWHAWNHWGSHPWHSRAQFIYLGSNLKMWSGGCRNHCHHCTGWHTYCLNGQDTWDATHNPSGYMTHDHWKIYVKKTGFFRVNFFAIQHGCPGHWQARILKSGSSIHQTHNYRNWHNGHGWSTTSMDQIWYFSNGHNVQIQLYSPSNSCNQYLWHAWNNYGQHSRVQMTWKGAKVIMWSGGCAHHMVTSGWRDYCINRSDFNHCGGNCHADGGSHFYFRKAGFWSVRFYTIQNGSLHGTVVRFQDNHRDILYSHMYKWTNTGWTQLSGDLIWYFHANHHMRVSIYAGSHGWLWHAWGGAASWSRVQYLFVGTQAAGSRIRQRYVTKKPQNGGNACPGLTHKAACSA